MSAAADGKPSQKPHDNETGGHAAQDQWASDVLAKTLRALGYRYLAMVPGSSFRGLQDSLVNHLGNTDPQIVMTLHEVQSVFIAQGYARALGSPMAAALHANVGLLNGSMGIYDTWCDRQPMLVIGATGPVDANRRRPWIDWVHTSRDQGALVRNYVKWDDQPASVEAAVESLLRADQITRTRPHGPVYVCLDAGLQESKLAQPQPTPQITRYAPAAAPSAGTEAINALLTALRSARRPILLFGRGRRAQAAWDARVALAEATGATVITGLHAASVFPTTHAAHVLPPLGDRRTEAESEALRNADLVVSFDWNDLAGLLSSCGASNRSATPSGPTVAHISLETYITNGWTLDHQALPAVDIPVLADADQVVSQLCEALGQERLPERRLASEHWTVEADRRRTAKRGTPMRSSDVSYIVTDALKDLPVTYARMPFGWSPYACRFTGPLDFLGKDAGGTVGSGPGHCVGTALALKDSGRLVVGVIGDGDFSIGMQALWTASHMELPLLMIVVNNRSYFNDEVHQERVARERGRPVENKWIGQRIEPALDIPAIARAQGFKASSPVTNEDDLRKALAEAAAEVQAGGRRLIDVSIEGGYEEK